jgi:VanZ family protein
MSWPPDETSRFIVPFLRWLLPGAAPATLDLLHEAIRKLGHVSEFAILAVLWYRGLSWERQARRPKAALAAFALTLAFAGLDEVHQAFVATRTASVMDVGWDGLGALCGVVGSGVLWGGRGALSVKIRPRGRSSGALHGSLRRLGALRNNLANAWNFVTAPYAVMKSSGQVIL